MHCPGCEGRGTRTRVETMNTVTLGHPHQFMCVGLPDGSHAPGCKNKPCTRVESEDEGLYFTEACGEKLPKRRQERLKVCKPYPERI